MRKRLNIIASHPIYVMTIRAGRVRRYRQVTPSSLARCKYLLRHGLDGSTKKQKG